jgi:translation initiation factor 3 subunit G
MARLDGYGYDHLILRVQWAEKREKKEGADTQFRSGYGKALPQGLG